MKLYCNPVIKPKIMKQLLTLLINFIVFLTFAQAINLNSYRKAKQSLPSSGRLYNKFFKKKPFENEYDFIVIGAGPGGATVANRLSENFTWRVLLLEAGPNESEIFKIPALQFFSMRTTVDWAYHTEPQENACLGLTHQRCLWPRGKQLGGSSSINEMIYTRGHREDYEDWVKLGNIGWSYEEVLPYFLKSEKASYELLKDVATSSVHNHSGYVGVQHIPYHYKIGKAMLKALPELNFSLVDYNNGDLPENSYSPPQLMEKNGLRCSASRAYLEEARYTRPNLHVVTNSFVTKILIDPVTKTATGVEVSNNFQTYVITARKEVILSAGTLNSAQLLMLSGIGPKDHLEELGIPVIQDLPVGKSLTDHPSFFGLVFTVNETDVTGTVLGILDPLALLQLYTEGKGRFTSDIVESLAFISTKYNTENRPDIEIVFLSSTFLATSLIRKNYFHLSDEVYNAVYKPYEGKEAWMAVPIGLRPKSVGYMKLKSSSPYDYPLFYPNYLKEEDDVNRLVEGIKFIIEVSQTTAMQKYGSKLIDTKIPACQAFDFGSDDYWKCAIKQLTFLMHHQSGTCKMGPEGDPTAVVSPELKVHGIKSLRVIDASVIPKMPSAHLTAPTYMIGEKGSDLIKSTWFHLL